MDLDFIQPDYTPEQMAQYLTDFVCDQYHLANTYKCTRFMDILHQYDYIMDYHYAHDRVSPTEQEIAAAGLVLMFNTKWLVEPAFVNWNEMKYCVYEIDPYSLRDVFVLDKFIEKIEDPKLKMTIIKHLLKFYYPRNRDLVLLLERERIAANSSTPTPSSPVTSVPTEPIDSIIFTKKAKAEHKETCIIEALQKSMQGRRDKTRAFVQELQEWQKEGYIDPHYNAQVMYDELAKIIPLHFGYEVFKKHYNNTRS